MEEDKQHDPTRDLVFIAGEGTDFELLLNGRKSHQPIELQEGRQYRLRLMNVTASTPNLQYWLVADSTTVLWRQIARDGFEVPSWQRSLRRAEEFVSVGQTFDFEIVVPAAGQSIALEARRSNGTPIARQPFTVRRP